MKIISIVNILFIGYWGVNEGLSTATIDPHLKVLSSFDQVRKIIYTSIERNDDQLRQLNIPKVKHIPLHSGNTFTDKYNDYTRLPLYLVTLCQQFQLDTIICRGAPAGALGYLVWKKTHIPFFVESFEPHADYMLESGVWTVVDPRYWLSRYWEKQQKRYASGLICVAENYRQQLIRGGVNAAKIKTVPCTVDVEQFSFNIERRHAVRKFLKVAKESIVGIYVGKYGGIYMDKGAFQFYQQAFDFWKDFFLIILSPKEQHSVIRSRMQEFCIPSDSVFIKQANHEEVPAFLSASDFAFATVKPSKRSKYCSAVKIGEYWANGLPILLPPSIGDDSKILVDECAGLLINNHCIDYSQVDNIIKFTSRSKIQKIAIKFRSRKLIEKGYRYFFAKNDYNL